MNHDLPNSKCDLKHQTLECAIVHLASCQMNNRTWPMRGNNRCPPREHLSLWTHSKLESLLALELQSVDLVNSQIQKNRFICLEKWRMIIQETKSRTGVVSWHFVASKYSHSSSSVSSLIICHQVSIRSSYNRVFSQHKVHHFMFEMRRKLCCRFHSCYLRHQLSIAVFVNLNGFLGQLLPMQHAQLY